MSNVWQVNVGDAYLKIGKHILYVYRNYTGFVFCMYDERWRDVERGKLYADDIVEARRQCVEKFFRGGAI